MHSATMFAVLHCIAPPSIIHFKLQPPMENSISSVAELAFTLAKVTGQSNKTRAMGQKLELTILIEIGAQITIKSVALLSCV